MVNYSKIVRFAYTYGEQAGNQTSDVDVLISSLWDGSPPSVGSDVTPTVVPTSQPVAPSANSGSEVPGYIRVRETPGQDVQQMSAQILSQIRSRPIGTTVPFAMNGVNYMARLETHPPSPRNPVSHPGISLFVQTEQPRQQWPNMGLNSFRSNQPAQLSERSKRIISQLQPPDFQQQVIQLMLQGLSQGLRPEITEGLRSQDRQDQLYEQGRSNPGQVVTQTRNSMHTKGMAVDIAQLDEHGNITFNAQPDFWDRMGAIGRSLGLNWGGDWSSFKDRPHFQYKSRQ